MEFTSEKKTKAIQNKSATPTFSMIGQKRETKTIQNKYVVPTFSMLGQQRETKTIQSKPTTSAFSMLTQKQKATQIIDGSQTSKNNNINSTLQKKTDKAFHFLPNKEEDNRPIQMLKQTIVQHGEMSGDQFQIAVALALDPQLRLILIGEGNGNPQDKSASIYDFYVNQTGIDPQRIHFIRDSQNMVQETKEILHTCHENIFDQETTSVGQATNVLFEAFFKENLTSVIRDTWVSRSGYHKSDFGKLVRRYKIPFDYPVVVLWSRQSGALGGLHPEHDSSYQGLEQMTEAFSSLGYTVIIVGDDPDRKIAGMKGSIRYRNAIRLGQFWELVGLCKKPRTAQFAFFEFLREYVPSLTHIGMRSGNLEAYAYMGHHVIFLEEQGRQDSARMDKLVGMNTYLNYDTIKLQQLPTRTGRLMDNMGRYIKSSRSDYKTLAKNNAKSQKLIKRLSQRKLSAIRDFHSLEEEISTLPDYQQKLKKYQFMKKNNSEVFEMINTEPKGFSSSDLNKIITETQVFEDPEDMDFGMYAIDEHSLNPEVMFWRNLDDRIRYAGENRRILREILSELTREQRQHLRESYQTDIDLVLGYDGRVKPRVQRLVISLINEM